MGKYRAALCDHPLDAVALPQVSFVDEPRGGSRLKLRVLSMAP
jgi:hypothetical protein